MLPIFLNLPAWLVALICGALSGTIIFSPQQDKNTDSDKTNASTSNRGIWIGAVLGAGVALGITASGGWLNQKIPLRGYGAMMTIGFLLGVWLIRLRAEKVGIDPALPMDISLWCLVGGLFGARAFHVVQNWNEFSPFGEAGLSGLGAMLRVWEGGLVFYGAFLPGVIIVYIFCRKKSIPVMMFLDLAAPSLMIGQAFGRLGCFLYGCCYGKICTLPWAVSFPIATAPNLSDESPAMAYQRFLAASHQTPILPSLHPTQLYAAISAGLLAIFLFYFWPKRRFNGQVFGLMMLTAGTTRFFEEILRADTTAPLPGFAPTISIAQWLAMVLFVAGLGLLLLLRNKGLSYPSTKELSEAAAN